MKTSDSRTKLLTERPIPLMISLCVPAVIGMLVVGLYSFMDGVFVGQMVGTAGVGAVSVSYPFTLINNGLAIMVGVRLRFGITRLREKRPPPLNKIGLT